MTTLERFLGPGLCGAAFSEDRQHRYTLWRRFSADVRYSQMVAFIGLNPSTADETKNDPTVSRCIKFAKRWGGHGMVMLNAFAYRATDPQDMKIQGPRACGPDNDAAIEAIVRVMGTVVCCWGVHGRFLGRDKEVLALLARVAPQKTFHLGRTKNGNPKHPLYLRGDTVPERSI